MTEYRIVCRHVRYWRGSVHRWSTVWRFTGALSTANVANATTAMYTMEQKVCYPGVTTHQGGLYEIAVYDHASGGVPILTTTYFDYTNPAGWINYTGTAYASPFGTQIATAEVAMLVEWNAGVSSTGKPVRFRKWFHSVPNSTATSGGADVAAGDVTTIKAAIDTGVATIDGYGAVMGSGSRLAALGCTVLTHYGNHQMPRGRRRRASTASVPSGAAVTGPFKILLD